ncbi:hypothetical protein [Pelovirga terrestris]|uniref:DUF5610 domain-containing protein n=1 Tax=Pelovirga terrestris TaxID=2771352 RepID=A0A8J6UPZ8_9BACT|nr:hypothetical protein [Pelovirga terrestris]MBD1401249.1 hypothetical protein [Pelovirga terrestris]
MAQQIDPTGGSKPLNAPLQGEKAQHKPAHQPPTGGSDRVSLGENNKAQATYGPGLNVAEPYELLRQLVVKTLLDQGAAGQVDTGREIIDLATLTPEQAQALVADDGYFGVEQTSDRIVDFAINAFGSDPGKLQQMKDAIDKGFNEAQQAFGGALPEISQNTYAAIMEKLDTFAAGFDQEQ